VSLASVKSRSVLPFWYQLTRVVPEKGPLNVCAYNMQLHIVVAYDGTSGAGRLPTGVGLGPIRDGTVGAGLAGAPGAGLCVIDGFGGGPERDPGTDLGDGGLQNTQSNKLEVDSKPVRE